ncbi:MAG: ORF6N domain-containing protein [Duncaniella sp.]|uniref:ORF6N domain-containing protein n=1 Tax=Duncaniella sp. TaxID=2518496 RepID=UPI0023C0AFB6|nr:ORF6N domain-containing protein [Duncaniella sp.]MDE5989307.1 ORF6N domain-containing protein [Duncaniella sp.]
MKPKEEKSRYKIESVTICDRLDMPVRIESLIHIIRDQQVMLDADLARLYGVETKVLNQAVKRNIQRFPEDFMFQLSKDECLRSQFVTSNGGRGGSRYMPYAFTENGVAMLSGILRSDKAIEVNINIMRAFSAMRNFLMNNAAIFQRMDQLEMKQMKTDEKVDAILDKLGENEKPKEGVFFNGQIFDAYVLIADLIRQAKTRIVVIDNYIDDSVLVQLSKRQPGVTVDIYDGQISNQLRQDVEKHNKQYPGVTLHKYTKAHDRFVIIDETVYHIGASLKDLGNKLFAFSRMEVMTGSELLAGL